MKINIGLLKALPLVMQTLLVIGNVDQNRDGKISTEEGKAAAKAEVQVILGTFPELRENFKNDPAKIDRIAEKLIELASEFVKGSD